MHVATVVPLAKSVATAPDWFRWTLPLKVMVSNAVLLGTLESPLIGKLLATATPEPVPRVTVLGLMRA